MTAKELLDAGKLSAAIEQLNKEVRAHPADGRLRTFLFELLCFAGEYQRADRQLEVIGHQSASAEIGVQAYRQLMEAEKARQRLLSDGLQPNFLFPPPPYARLHLEALNRLRENRPAEARALLEEAGGSYPVVTGRLDGQPFADFQDSDVLIGPFLEVVIQGKYTWLPFAHIKRLQVSPPQKLRELLWTQARLETTTGPAGEVFLPALYVGSSTSTDESIQLGRMTDWLPLGDGLTRGIGQRVFLVDDTERAILEVKDVEFDASLES